MSASLVGSEMCIRDRSCVFSALSQTFKRFQPSAEHACAPPNAPDLALETPETANIHPTPPKTEGSNLRPFKAISSHPT
eukprot:11084783-Alexandrium_andersonii.AAC.1